MLTDYQRKIEEMMRQLSDYRAKVTKCEDQKATATVSLEKLESEKSDCLNSQSTVNKEKVKVDSEYHQNVKFALKILWLCQTTPMYTNALNHVPILLKIIHSRALPHPLPFMYVGFTLMWEREVLRC